MYNGTIATEEVLHHWQAREVLSEINKSGLTKLLDFPYRNMSNVSQTFKNELFDDATKNFVKHFKRDIQGINNGKLSIREFKRQVGNKNFSLFKQTADMCVNDNNIVHIPTLVFANSTAYNTDDQFPDKATYNKFGNTLVKRMSTRRDRFLERTKGTAGIDIFNSGKFLEEKLQNRHKDISDGLTR